MENKKIGVITWHYYHNFGSALQAYALQYSLCSYKNKCSIINYRDKRIEVYVSVKVKIQILLTNLNILKKYRYPFTSFHAKFLNQTPIEHNTENLHKIVSKFDAVLCGSDQIWAPNVFNPVYMLDFVPDDIPKISYAASIGLNEIPDDLVGTYQRLLSRFQAISVREKQGAQLLDQRCGIKSEVVLDPTLLVNVVHWKELEKKVNRKDKFIFCYFLNKNHRYKEAVQAYAKRHGIEVIGCSANTEDASWMTILGNDIGPCEFLWLIHHAEAVFTDSYHGTIFSLLYHKPFVTFERFESSDKICQNSRIYQLDDYFCLSQRIIRVTHDTEIVIDDFDYDMFERRLCELRKSSMEFLKRALGG